MNKLSNFLTNDPLKIIEIKKINNKEEKDLDKNSDWIDTFFNLFSEEDKIIE